jgi:hypothetical protein
MIMSDEGRDSLTSRSGDLGLPRGIQTYERKSEAIARKLATDYKTGRLDRQKLGEQLIRESTEAVRRKTPSG